MKILYILFLPLLMCNSIQIEGEKTFDLDKAKINGLAINKIDKEDLFSMFGKPIKVSSEINEFTGEKFYMHYYDGISFEVSESGKAFPDEISNNKIAIDVLYASQQINLLKNSDGNIIEGNPSQIDHMEDVWTFAKTLNSRETWKLVKVNAT